MKLTIPELSLVVLVGPSGAGKSTFARKHFLPTEILSSDYCRALVSDDETNQAATHDAFAVLHFIAARRLAAGRLTVADATNVQSDARKPLLALARQYHVLPVAIVFDLPERLCVERNAQRPNRAFGARVVRQHVEALRRIRGNLDREGFRVVHILSSPEEVEAATVERVPLWVNRKHETGPFDIIGDIHGCCDELKALLEKLGYTVAVSEVGVNVTPPAGRKAVFLGDLVDRGPDSPGVLDLVMGMVEAGTALCLLGNHDNKLLRKLLGRDVQITHALAETLTQMEKQPPEFVERVRRFLDGLISHYVLDGGKLVVAHAGLRADLQGRASNRVRDFCLYGDTTGETDEFGVPVRLNWAADYRGKAMVVYGHTPVVEADWLNNTINIDTGCVFGGKLSALRYPEKEIVSVPAARQYCEPRRPAQPLAPGLSAQQQADDVLDLADVAGKRVVATRLMANILVREENSAPALEVMSRFAADPKWLIYLPPTMSPCETARAEGLLEHPAEAFAYFHGQGVAKVVCQAKHMGSRAVAVVGRDAESARKRFGAVDSAGVCLTRTGRRFFDDTQTEAELLDRLRAALTATGFWERFDSDWFCLDCELMPWSAKARELLKQQYAAVGAASRAALAEVVAALGKAAETPELAELLRQQRDRLADAGRFVEAYRRYCWPVTSVADLRLAPFHLLAAEGKAFFDRDHLWHMETLTELCRANPETLTETPFLVVDPADEASQAAGVRWWEEMTARGGEGMVVKPLDFVARGPKGLVQPAVKVRGREYLRIIYGPEYAEPNHLSRLRERGLGAKRSLALREFALGVEALERFVAREPLRRVHECVFGVLALETTPVDPRL